MALRTKLKSVAKRFLKMQGGGIVSSIYNHLPFNNRISLHGKDNDVHIKGNYLRKCRLSVHGNNNRIEIRHLGCNFLYRCTIYISGDNNRILIDGAENVLIDAEIWMEDNDNECIVGSHNAICGKTHMAITEGTVLRIGSDCLLSANITFRTGDSHSILSADTGTRINHARSIVVSDRVWIGNGATILKGVNIEADSIVGTGAVVTKSPGKTNIILGGNPAKIIKENIEWRKERRY